MKFKSIRERKALNKKAFEETINNYLDMHCQSTIRIMDTCTPNGTTVNPASPSFLDFFCDVENTIKDGAGELRNETVQHFVCGEDKLNEEQQNYIEQKIGQLFISRNIWPVNKYFLTIRKKQKQ